jgi:hypothetical protein
MDLKGLRKLKSMLDKYEKVLELFEEPDSEADRDPDAELGKQ